MCGIWGYISSEQKTAKAMRDIYESFYNGKQRGPENSTLKELNDFVNVFVGFHRLSIMDIDNKANQPFEIFQTKTNTIFVSCNGEIYNYKELIEKEDLKPKSESDCEVIVLLIEKYGVDQMLQLIDGEFAISVVEIERNKKVTVHLARDHIGIRPLYYAFDAEKKLFAYCSDLKGMTYGGGDALTAKQIVKDARQVVPGVKMTFTFTNNVEAKEITGISSASSYFRFDQFPHTIKNLEEAKKRINKDLRKSVKDRLMTDRPFGSLLSGGLDSSLVSAIAAEICNKGNEKLRTYSVGMPGATDREFAEMVAKHIDSVHVHVEFSEEDFLNAIDETVRIIGSFDITTIRASVGLVLISKWISENTDIKVLLTGEGSDELTSGYMYFHKAPTPEASHQENLRLLGELYLYDLLRGDRCIADFGLEARIPFLDRTFMETYLRIDPKLRIPTMNPVLKKRVEKWLLRTAFEDDNLLPFPVLWRKKEAFSDGVSSVKRSWFQMIQEVAEKKYTDAEFETRKQEYAHMTPTNKESLYFRDMYEKHYGKNIDKIVPDYWLPRWCGDVKEPSARVLESYKQEGDEDN